MCSYMTLTSFEYRVCAAVSHWQTLSTVYVQLYDIDILVSTVYVQLYHTDILWVLCMCSCITLTFFECCVCAGISHWHPSSTVYVQVYHIAILWVLCTCSYMTLTSFEYCVCAAIWHWHPLSTVYVQLYDIDILWILHTIRICKRESRYINVIFFLSTWTSITGYSFEKSLCVWTEWLCMSHKLKYLSVRTTEIKVTGMWLQIHLLHSFLTHVHTNLGFGKDRGIKICVDNNRKHL
jgi:hypothetical protein